MKQLLNYIRKTKTPYRQHIITTQYDTYTVITTYSQQGDKLFSILGMDRVLSGIGGTLQMYKETIENWESIIGKSILTLKPHSQSKINANYTIYYNTMDNRAWYLPHKTQLNCSTKLLKK